VVALAADRLSSLSDDQVPAAVRPFRRFAPRRRAQAAAVPLAAALEQDAAFRQLVCEQLPEALAAAVRSGSAPPAAPLEEVACAAYLLRPEGWEDVVDAAGAELAERDRVAAGAATLDEVRRLTEQLEALRTSGREEAERLTAERDAARAEAAAAVRRAREAGSRAAAAERALAAAALPDPVPEADVSADVEPVADAGEVRRLRSRLRTAEEALASARAAARGERREAQVRLRVLLDAVVGAAGGLQRELGLPPLDERPADALAASYAAPPGTPGAAAQGRSDDDPALLDALLSAPAVHLLVDGYNVTKTGYGEQSLEVQRGRLLAGLGALAARTGVELTVVFDGAGSRAARAPATVARGGCVCCSAAGADGRRRACASSCARATQDARSSSSRATGEVADDVRRDGARPGRAARCWRSSTRGADLRACSGGLVVPAPSVAGAVLDRRRPPWRPLCSSTATVCSPSRPWPAPTASSRPARRTPGRWTSTTRSAAPSTSSPTAAGAAAAAGARGLPEPASPPGGPRRVPPRRGVLSDVTLGASAVACDPAAEPGDCEGTGPTPGADGGTVRELHVVALSEDGRHVVLATRPGTASGEFRVALDERLTAAVRGELPPRRDAPPSISPARHPGAPARRARRPRHRRVRRACR
jgi:hypothetical protein